MGSAARPTEVRRAAPGDADAIARLGLEVQALHVEARPDLFKPGGSESPAEVLARIAAGDPQMYWVATIGDAVAGYVYARLSDEPETRWRWATRVLVLDAMGVAEGYRGRGVGQSLWEAVRREAEARGADRVVLNVWAFNAPARRFYERLGFSPFHERMAVELRGGRA